MRARNIKPGFFKNDELAQLSPLTRILFAGLWCFADRDGRFEWRPAKIKAEILPYDNGEITVMLQELNDHKFISHYIVDGVEYGFIPTWKDHQNPHHTEKKSKIPQVPDNYKKLSSPLFNGEITVNPPLKDGKNPADSLIPDSLIPDSRKQEAPPGKKEAAPPPAEAGFFKPFGGSHFSNKAGEYLNAILDHAQSISLLNNKHPPFNVFKFIQFHFKNKTHPGAIMETLEAIKDQWKNIKEPWSYGMSVIKTKNGNWYEKEEIKKYQEVEEALNNILKTNPAVKKLLADALKTV